MIANIISGPGGGVLWVDISAEGQSVRVVGYCRYWVGEDRAGAFNCPDHEDDFGGPVSYRWTGVRFVRENEPPPPGTLILHGEWVDDDEWVGSMGDGEAR